MTSDYFERVDEAISKLVESGEKRAVVVHHDDADGLCSGAIICESLRRAGFEVKTICLEKLFREVVDSIHRKEEGVVLYCDIGSSHADYISSVNRGRLLTIILDHHEPRQATDPAVIDLNPENFGIRGEEEASGATVCYLFSKKLSEENVDLSYLAVVGSTEIPGGLRGLNQLVLSEALEAKALVKEGKSLKIPRIGETVQGLFSKLQILGSVGYYRGGPSVGVEASLHGFSQSAETLLKDLEEKRKAANKKLLAILYRRGLNKTEHIQWFDSGDVYRGMGAKVVGTFCSFISYQAKLIDPSKYIMGFMRVPREVPGFGELQKDYVKVSVRIPKKMQPKIDSGELLNAYELLLRATADFGIADGHAYAASAVFAELTNEQFVQRAEDALGR